MMKKILLFLSLVMLLNVSCSGTSDVSVTPRQSRTYLIAGIDDAAENTDVPPALAGRFFLSPTHLGRFPSLRHKAAYLEPSSLYQPLVLGCLLKIYLNAQEEGGESSMHCRHNRKLTECSFPVTPTLQLHITPQLRQCSCESELLPPILDPTGPRWYPTQPFSPV